MQFGFSQIRVAEVRVIECAAAQFRTLEIGIAERGAHKGGVGEFHAAQVRVNKLRVACPNTLATGATQVSAGKIRSRKLGFPHSGVSEIRASQLSVCEYRFQQRRILEARAISAQVLKVRANERGAPKNGICDIGVDEQGARTLSASKTDSGEIKTRNVGVKQAIMLLDPLNRLSPRIDLAVVLRLKDSADEKNNQHNQELFADSLLVHCSS
ncbi:MAG: hypothetical protein OXN94_17005 [Chloroflexota bacterium]|nr:hypothetical protein [Chloroflexota bacterium]